MRKGKSGSREPNQEATAELQAKSHGAYTVPVAQRREWRKGVKKMCLGGRIN